MAEWENKTGKAIENRIYNEQKRNFDNQVEKFVDIRRKKLSDLLNKRRTNIPHGVDSKPRHSRSS